VSRGRFLRSLNVPVIEGKNHPDIPIATSPAFRVAVETCPLMEIDMGFENPESANRATFVSGE